MTDAIMMMRRVGLHDREHIIRKLSDALSSTSHKRTFWDIIRFRPAYKKTLPEQIADLVKTETTLSEDEVRARLDSLSMRESVQKAVLNSLRLSGYALHGFPVSDYEAEGFQSLVAASLYRFAYGVSRNLEPEEHWKADEFQGCYKLFLRAHDSEWVREHLLVFFPVQNNRIEVIELYPTDEGITARSGVIIPSHERHTALMSDQYDEGWMRDMLNTEVAGWDECSSPVLIADRDRPSSQSRLLQSQNLSHLELVFSNDSVRGRYLIANEAGFLAGARLKAEELNCSAIDSLRSYSKDSLADQLSDQERRIVDQLGKTSFTTDSSDSSWVSPS